VFFLIPKLIDFKSIVGFVVMIASILAVLPLVLVAVSTLAYPVFLMVSLLISPLFVCRHLNTSGTDQAVRDIRTYVSKHWKASSSRKDDENPDGLIIGYDISRRFCFVFPLPFVAFIVETPSEKGLTVQIWFFATKSVSLQKAEVKAVGPVSQTIDTLTRVGQFFNIKYKSGKMLIPRTWTKRQKDIANLIIKNAKLSQKNGYGFNVTVFVHGPPGTGKSNIAMLVTDKLKGVLCNNHDPTYAGDELSALVSQTDKTLVVSLDEWDIVIAAAYGEKVKAKEIKPLVYNKSTYNLWMDRLRSFENVIFVITSNLSYDEISSRWPSSLRKGRVDFVYECSESLERITGERFKRW
jgi:hypothetical protein